MSAGVAYVGPSGQTAYVLCAGPSPFLLAATRPFHLPLRPELTLLPCATDCGTPIEPNGANLCVNCLRNSCVPSPSLSLDVREPSR